MQIKLPAPAFIILMLLLLLAGGVKAQISSSVSSGCAPLVGVNFTGVAGASNVTWDFDDGSTSSILNPSHTFTNPGIYTVTYTATVGGNTVSHSLTISVYGKPTAIFTATSATSGCAPLTVNFQSQSTGGGGTNITTHNWSFGDGGVNTGNNSSPSYTFTMPGQYVVNLIVVDQNGCDSSYTLPDTITISNPPNAIITSSPSPATSCNPPLTVTFNASSSTSNSPLGSTLTYSWDFGNGNTSTSVTPPSQTYTSSGVYPVWLTVTDDNNCSDSISTNVTIANPFASFDSPDTVCMEAVFVDTASSPGVYFWNYGDGTTGFTPTHTYSSPGLYNVTLTVYAGNCQDDTTRQIYVQDVIADFNIVPSYSCSLPQTINLVNNSVNGYSYAWTFLDTTTHYDVTPVSSTVFQPVLTVTDLDTNRYTIHELDDIIDITLIVTSYAGCVDSITKLLTDSVFLPTARIQPDVSNGCAPLAVTFSDSSISNESIVSRIYDFGDGTVINSNVTSISHTYTNPGTYYAKMVLVNSEGCTDTSYAMVIEVGGKPFPNFSVAPNPVCIGDPVQFTDLSVSAPNSPIDTWHYYTDNGFLFSASCWDDPNPSGPYLSSTGPQTVTLEVCSHGCCSDTTISNAVTVLGPLVEFTSKSHCDTPYTYTFTGTIGDADNWTWDLGDGTVINTSTQSTLTHTYATPGYYTVTLIGTNSTSGCQPDTFSRRINAVKAMAAFSSADTIFCSGDTIQFDGSFSQNVYNFGQNGYIWLWGDGTSPTIGAQSTSQHIFSPGIHNVRLIVSDINGCNDTASFNVKASSVTADFVPDSYAGCVPWTVNFTDLSTSDTTITNWTWDFGDTGTGTGQNVAHTYVNNTQANFNVTLTATNVLGCMDTTTIPLQNSIPNAQFVINGSANICAGDSVKFTPVINNHTIYDWQFGDGDSIISTSPYHTYTSGGNYTVSLTVTDTIGCQRSYTYPVTIKVQDYPQAGFSSNIDTLTELCYPLQVIFTDTSIANVFQSRQWDLGNGSAIVPSVSVGTNYNNPGSYTVSLIVNTTFGCADTAYRTFDITGPAADFDFGPGTICKGQTVNFNIKDTSRVYTYHWDFGDGSDTTAVSPISHLFDQHPPSGQANVTLIVWSSDSSCAKTYTKQVTIHQVIADFDRNAEATEIDTAHCLGTLDNFVNQSTNASSYFWDFGDGSTSTSSDPNHMYTTAGTYPVSLAIVNSTTGCVDTLEKTMIIHPLPVVAATGGDTCLGSSVQLHASGGDTYSWTPSSSLDDPTSPDPIATPAVTTVYTASITDTNGCPGIATATATILQPPPSVTWDTAIVIGESVTLPYSVTPVSNYIFTWTPTDSLSCTDCPNPVANPTVNTTYTLTVQDKEGCFSSTSTFYIEILPVSSVDVPSAFTPNGDGINDIVYVEGWGIKKLISFDIYNRWGELVFSSNDINIGWDGTYKGKLQNTESYAYTVVVETYIDANPIEKKGFIKLLR